MPGKVLGGRFIVEGSVDDDPTGATLRARDNKTGKPISLRILPDLFSTGESLEFLKVQCRAAAQLRHPNILATYGLGRDAGTSFVASEWIDGEPLADVAKRRHYREEPFTLDQVGDILSGICQALEALGPNGVHGTLRPQVIYLGPNSELKVADFGTGRSLIAAGNSETLPRAEQPCLAPEVKNGSPPTTASDIFGIGAILYTVFTGSSPGSSFVRPSKVHPEATRACDDFLLRCLAPDPSARFASPAATLAEFRQIVASARHPEESPRRNSDSVEVSLDSLSPLAKPANSIPISIDSLSPGADATGPAPLVPSESSELASDEIDLKALAEKLAEPGHPSWMAAIDGVDHGPFTAMGLIDRIVQRRALGHHEIFDVDDVDKRWILDEHPDFQHFVRHAEIKARLEEESANVQKAARVEKTGNAFKIGTGVAAVVAICVGATLFILDRNETKRQQRAQIDMGDLYETGEIDITGTAQILEAPRPRGARGTAPRHQPGQAGQPAAPRNRGGSLSYEEAMNQPMELGDVTQGGGEQRLNAGTIQGIMNRHINALYGCAVAERSRGGSLSSVRINLAIGGNGRVIGASPAQGSPAFRACIQGRAMAITFPTFAAPRMGASFSFMVD